MRWWETDDRRRTLRLFAVIPMALVIAACSGQAPTAGPPELPIIACSVGGAGGATAPPGFIMVAPGTIAFGYSVWHNVSGSNLDCGAQAVSDPRSVIPFSTLLGEDRISWAATLAWPSKPAVPLAQTPTMTLVRVDPIGEVVVDRRSCQSQMAYQCAGNYGHDALPGVYRMRIASAAGDVLAEGTFEISK